MLRQVLLMEPEDGNPHDKFAVEVVVWGGCRTGYLKKTLSFRVRALLQ
jgi:hypothetical protein